MTYMFQTLDRTAVSERRGVKIIKKPQQPYEMVHYVPQQQDTVAGKLKDCQALGPRIQLLENKIRQAQDAPPVEKPKPIIKETKKIGEVRTEDLKQKQTQAVQMKKEKQLARLRFALQTEKKKDDIVRDRDQTKEHMEKVKMDRFANLMEKQKNVKTLHEKKKQKLADINAIKDFQSKKIVEERKQQKEYELMLQRELDEELKNMKQREVELKMQLIMGVQKDEEYGRQSESLTKDSLVVEKVIIEGNRQQKRSHDLLRQQMQQERIKRE